MQTPDSSGVHGKMRCVFVQTEVSAAVGGPNIADTRESMGTGFHIWEQLQLKILFVLVQVRTRVHT